MNKQRIFTLLGRRDEPADGVGNIVLICASTTGRPT